MTPREHGDFQIVEMNEHGHNIVSYRAHDYHDVTPLKLGVAAMYRLGLFGKTRTSKIATLAVAFAFAALIVQPTWAANGSVVYTYDPLGRLTTASYDTGVCVIYSYDANGNRLSQIVRVGSGTGGTGYWGCFNWGQANWGGS